MATQKKALGTDDANATPESLADSASQGNMMALYQHAGMLGQMAAFQRLSTTGDTPNLPTGSFVGGGPTPAPPQSQVPASALITPGSKDILPAGGGSTNYGERQAFDKAQTINIVKDAATTVLQQHQQRDIATTQRKFEMFMTATQALKINPNDQHNLNILNHLGEDKQFISGLKKVMGFDAFDQKAEADKQKDPQYQAYQKALTSLPDNINVGPGVNLSKKDMTPILQSQSPSGNTGEPAFMSGLNDGAKNIFKQIPNVLSVPNYIPSAAEVGQTWRIASKIAPSADEALKANSEILKLQVQGLVDFSKMDSDQMVAKIRAQGEAYRGYFASQERTGVEYKLGLLKIGQEQQANNLKSLELGMKGRELDEKDYNSVLDGTRKEIEINIQRKNELEGVLKNKEGLTVEGKKALTQEFEEVNSQLRDRVQKLDSYSKGYQQYISKNAGIALPPPPKDAGSVVDNLEGKGNGSATASPVGKPATGQPVTKGKAGTSSLVPGSITDTINSVKSTINKLTESNPQ